MNDIDIRVPLINRLTKFYKKSDNTFIYEEFPICGGASRVDIAVVNGAIHGYEIKSPKDNLARLASQTTFYNSTLDYVHLVTDKHHLKKAEKLIPEWWGILLVERKKNNVQLTRKRAGKKNKHINLYAVSQFLWRPELVQLLVENNLVSENTRKTKSQLCELIANKIPKTITQKFIREKLKTRSNWLPDHKHILCDD